MTADVERKRELLRAWLTDHASHPHPLHSGGPLDARVMGQQLLARWPRAEECVYVLVRHATPGVPLYIGRTGNAARRWQSHLAGVISGQKKYRRWTSSFAAALDLYVIPVGAIQYPPIPHFPVTAGAVETQLISLAQDTVPLLLNREGVGRAGVMPASQGGAPLAQVVELGADPIHLGRWLGAQGGRSAPLFAVEEDDRTVCTHQRGRHKQRQTLRRHADFDTAMMETVEQGLDVPNWQGLLYIMFTGAGEDIQIRYIGKAERQGVKHALSVNLARIRTNHDKFGRWGYASAYHLGDLSHAVLGEAFRPGPAPGKYQRWREALFTSAVLPVLHEPVSVCLIPWHLGKRGPSGLQGSVAAVEYELIALASLEHAHTLLNTQGR